MAFRRCTGPRRRAFASPALPYGLVMRRLTHSRAFVSLSALSLMLVLLAACADPPGAPPTDESTDSEQIAGSIAEVTRIRGAGGLHESNAEAGVFMGLGARLKRGQTLEAPLGVQAEIRLDGGGRIRLDEGTRITLPKSAGDPIAVETGDIVMMLVGERSDATSPVIELGDALVTLQHGELAASRHDGTRRIALVQGAATIAQRGESVALTPGASIELRDDAAVDPNAPGVARVDTDAGPGLTDRIMFGLAPLRDAAWSKLLDALDTDVAPNADDDPGLLSPVIAVQKPNPLPTIAVDQEVLPPGVGTLTARRAGSQVQSQRLRLVDQRVTVTVSGRIARTEIEQAFHNDANEQLEGTYRFPLPADASIAGLELLVGKTWMKGEMLEKERARQIFKQIVDATIPRDPALLEWQQGNEFKLRIFPIPPKGERRVRLAYTQVLPEIGGELRYRYPMNGSGAGGTEIENFNVDFAIDASAMSPAERDRIRSRAVDLQSSTEQGVLHMRATMRDFIPRGDLGVDIPAPAAASEQLSFLDRDGQAYVSTVLEIPNLALRPPEGVEWSFVLDRSHGVTTELWQLQRGLLEVAIARMAAEDRFTVLACDTDCDVLEGGLREARNLQGVEAFLNAQILSGASDLSEMLHDGREALSKSRPGTERVVVLLSDGVPTSGRLATDELVDQARRELDDIRIEAVALGGRADVTVLDALVRTTGGDLLIADPSDDLDVVARELALRARVPAARDLEWDLPPGLVDVHPKQLPAIRSGDQIMLVGKMTRPIDGTIGIRRRGSEANLISFPIQVDASAKSSADRSAHLPRTWAQEEIRWLTATQGVAAREQIIALSRAHNVISRWTALLVLENDAMYREFGVKRTSESTTGWNGEIAATAGTATSTPQPDAVPSTEPPSELPVVPADAASSADSKSIMGGASGQSSVHSKEEAEAQWSSGGDEFDNFERSENRKNAESSRSSAAEDLFDPFVEDPSPGSDDAEKAKKSAGPSQPAKKPSGGAANKDAMGKADAGAYILDDFDGGYGYGGGYGGKYRWHPSIEIGKAKDISASARARIDSMVAARDGDPTRRSLHRRLVRAAITAGDPRAMGFAEDWAQSDPDHAPALLALADLLAARGEAEAPRVYASAVEVDPFDRDKQRILVAANLARGDLARACSHQRALVSIDPKDNNAKVTLAACLHLMGREQASREIESTTVLDSKSRNRLDMLRRLLPNELTKLEQTHRPSGNVSLSLSWTDPSAELDLAIVDGRGRRRSVLHDQGLVFEQSQGREDTRANLSYGQSWSVEITRADAGRAPVQARLTVRGEGVSQTFNVEVRDGTVRVARVQNVANRYGHY